MKISYQQFHYRNSLHTYICIAIGVLIAFGAFLMTGAVAHAAIAFDAFSEDANAATGATGDFSWTHTPVGTPRGVLVYVVQRASSADRIDSVTYGSLTLTRVAIACDTLTEPGCVYAYVGTSNIPTGAQTVSVNETGGGGKHAAAYTFTADRNTEIVAFDNTVTADATNPSRTLTLDSRDAHISLGLFSGQGAVTGITPLAGWTSRDEEDFGNDTAGFYTRNALASTSVTTGWTQAIDDAAMIAVAIAEKQVPSISGTLYEANGSTTIATTTTTITVASLTGFGNITELTDWATTSAAGDNDAWESVTYGGGLYVAVGQGPDPVMTSPDGITWTARSAAGNDDDWYSVTYGNGLFVAVGGGPDRVMTSPDGINWTVRSAAGNDDLWYGVTYGNGVFVAVACGLICDTTVGDRVMTSSDGITWTIRSAAGDNDMWRSVTYGNGLFVAAGRGSDRVMTSPDGINWTARYFSGNDWRSVTYGNGLFVIVGCGDGCNNTVADRVLTSPDGINWTVRSAAGNNDSWWGVIYGNGLFVAVASDGSDRVMTSPDGINWTSQSAAGNNDVWRSITYANGVFVAVAFLGGTDIAMYANANVVLVNSISTTTDSSGNFSITLPDFVATSSIGSWATTSAAGNNDGWSGVVFGNGIFVAVSTTTDRVMTSPDGITWTARSAAGDDDAWEDVTYGDGIFVAVSRSGADRVMTSPDGITWTARTAAGSWRGVTYDNGLFVAVGTNGDRVMTSPDGITWTARTAAGNDDTWRDVAYAKGLFVAVGDFGDRVMTSPDGITWTARSAAGDNDGWQSVTYGNSLFVAVSDSGDRVMTSTDGITWTVRSAAGNDDDWQSVTFANGLFVAVGTNGDRVMTSPDGITWTARTAAGDNDSWYGVANGNGLFVAVGNSVDSVMFTRVTPAFNETLPLTLFVDSGGGGAKATTLTYLNGAITTGIHLWDGTVRISYASTTQQLDVANQLLYDGSNNADVLFTVNGATTTVGSLATATALVVASGTTFIPTDKIELFGNFTQSGSINFSSSTLIISGTEPIYSGSFVGSNSLGNVVVNTAEVDWQTQSAAGNNDTWFGVAYGNGRFVATQPEVTDTFMYSDDGQSWATTSPAVGAHYGLDITYANNQFISAGVGLGGSVSPVAVSSDGVSWSTVDIPGLVYEFYGVAYGAGTYVVVGSPISQYFGSFPTDATVAYSTDGVTWATTTVGNNTDYWLDVTYAEGKFVAVGLSIEDVYAGSMYSTDGITWATTTVPEGTWSGVTYGNGLFVAVSEGDSNRVMYSSDGITWTATTSADESTAWKDVTYRNGNFIAVGEEVGSGRVMTSPDGTTWTMDTNFADNPLSAVAYGEGTTVAVTPNGVDALVYEKVGSVALPLASTTDLTIPATKILQSTTSLSVAGNFVQNGQLLNTGTLNLTGTNKTVSVASTSPELGAVTVLGSIDFLTDATISDLTVASSGTLDPHTFLTLTGDFTQNGAIDFSGNTLTIAGSDSEFTGNFSGSNALNDVLLSGQFTPTPWRSVSGSGESDAWTSVVYANDIFVAVGDATGAGNPVMTSPDGEQWTQRSAVGDNDAWTDVTYGSSTFVAVGTSDGNDLVMTSSDGVSWIARSAADNNDVWTSVVYASSTFVAVGTGGSGRDVVMTSVDGITWATSSAAGNDDSWTGVTYGEGLFVAVSSDVFGTDRVMTSSDGVTWTARSVLDDDDDWQAIAYGEGTFVAVGTPGSGALGDMIMYSADGLNWNVATNPDGYWYDVTYGNGEFVAVGIILSGAAFLPVSATSPDGVVWNRQFLSGATNESGTGVAYGEGVYAAVGFGDDGAITSLINTRKVLGTAARITTATTNDFTIATSSSLQVTGSLSVFGDYLNQGLLETATGTMVFAGGSQQTATGTLEFHNLTVDNTSQNGTTSQSVVFGAPLVVTNTYTMNPGTSAAFLAGATSTLQNIDLVGTAGDEVYLRSTASGTRWGLDVPGEQINIEFVDVKDSYASRTATATNSIDSGNNINWFFVTESTGSSTIANHDNTQVPNAFNFQNKTNESLFAFKLIPNSGVATVTNLTLDLTGVTNVTATDFSNIRLLRDWDNDAQFDMTDTVIGGAGILTINASKERGSIDFTDDFTATTTQNYLVVADWNAPVNGAVMNIGLLQSGISATDMFGSQTIFGSVSSVQHGRITNRGGGGGRAQDIGGEAPVGNGVVTGGGVGPGEQIGNDPNFRRPTARSGSWTNEANAYDGVDGTYATGTGAGNSGIWQNHNFDIASNNTIQGIEVVFEGSSLLAQSIDVSISWNAGVSWTAAKTSSELTATDAVITVGGPADLWGRTWSVSDFSNSNFRLRFTGSAVRSDIQIDEIQVRVYNQASGGGSGGGVDI